MPDRASASCERPGSEPYAKKSGIATILSAVLLLIAPGFAAAQSLDFVDEDGTPSDTIREAGVARLRVVSTADNTLPSTAETLLVGLATLYFGDSETLTLTETGPDTGVFEGSIQLSGPWSGTGPGLLDTANSGAPDYLPEQVTATWASASDVATVVASEVDFLDGFGQVVATYAEGDLARVRVLDHNRNDPGFVDSFSVVVDAQFGDSETVTVTETGFDTATFTGAVQLGPGFSPGDGLLNATSGETLLAQHANFNDPGVTTAGATVVSSATWFVDEDGALASSFMESTRAFVRVLDSAANLSAGIVETATVDVSTELAGDSETLTLTETGMDTGLFEGGVALSLGSTTLGNGVLETTEDTGPPHSFETLSANYFDALGGNSGATASTFGSRTLLLDAFGNTVAVYATGSTVHVRVVDQNFNQDGVFDTVDVTVSSLSTGDSETLTIWETTKSGGVFEGSIDLEDSPLATPADGLVQAQAGEQVEAAHTDFLGLTQSTARATVEAARIEFVDAAGVPSGLVVESDWARVRLVSLGDNVDPGNAETVPVNVTTLYYGDDETVWLTETGPDTGVFEGAIRLAGPWTGTGPGFLDVANSGLPEYLPEEITATYSGLAQASAVAHTVSSVLELVDDFGQVVSTYPEGGVVRARVFDVNRNDPGFVDSFSIVVDAQYGDNETVTVTETGFDTSVFTGSVPLDSGLKTQGDGVLQVLFGETLLAQHSNYNDPGVTTASATIVGSATWFIDEAGEVASSYMESSQAVVRVADALANADPGLVETTTVDLSTELSGDSETLTLTETGPDTGVFEGTIPLSLDPAVAQDGVLETTQAIGPPHEWETLYASHTDGQGATSTASATTFGSSILFLDAFGNTVTTYATGSTVYVRVEDQNFNQDGVFDTVEVTVSSLTTGDSEPLTIWETAKSSGVFEGSIALEVNAASPADGLLQVQAGEEVEAAHTDFLGLTQSVARATIEAAHIELVDAAGVPSDVVVESDWARVRLVSPGDNADPFNADSLSVNVTTLYYGDDEPLWLTETGPDTGVFEGAIRLAGPWTGTGLGFLDVANSGSPEYLPEQITATYSGFAQVSAVAHTVSSVLELVDDFGQVVSTYPEGGVVRARVFDVNRNDPGFVDSFSIVVDAQYGDNETVTVTETGFDTSVFTGSVPLDSGLKTQGDGVLQVLFGETLLAQHANYNDPGVTTASATIVGSATWFIDEAGEVASSYMESSQAVVRVADALANADPGLVETTTVDLSTELSGDSETLTLTETGPDTGVFEGTIPLSLDPAVAQDGVLETSQAIGPPHEWETLYASHTDGQGATSTASATTFGSNILFIDAFGNTVTTYATGSTVYVRVEDQNFNQDGVFDTVEVTVSSLTTGDSEPLTIWETSKSSGVFEGSIALEVNAANLADGLLQVQAGEEVEAAHTDFLGLTQSVVRATIEAAHIELVDAAGVPSDVVVESDWARVRLVSPGDNADPFNAETVLINVTTLYYGDDETLLLTETGADTGVFAGAIRLAGPWTGTGPGFLDVANSGLPEYLPEQITATYSGFAQVSAVAHTVSSVLELVDDFGQVVSTYPEGGVVRARVFDVNRNDPGFVDSFSIVVDAQYGDNETVTVTETGFDTSVFTGSVPLDSGLKTQGDGVLQVLFGETLLAQHANYNDPGVTTASATIVGSATWFIDEAGEAASSYMESSEAVVRVADALANVDPGLVETTTVELSTELSGDSETLTLTETGPDTGVFEGTIPLSLDPAVTFNGVLETTQAIGPPHEWETLYASHTDGQGATSTASATTFGSDILFLDAFGNTAATYAIGSTVYVRVEDQNFNQDGVFNTVEVTVSSLTTGDSEPLTIWETSKSSGVFEGSIALEVNAASPADGLLQVQAGEEVEAAHTDFLGLTQSVARATIEAAHIEFVDAAGVPSDVVVESDWARVRLVSPGDNADPFNADSLSVNVTTLYYGDDEPLWLTETGPDTGVFEGAIRLAGPWTGTGLGFLDVANSGLPEYLPEEITATYSGLAQVSAVAHTASSVLEFVDDFGQGVSTYPTGGVVRLRVFDVNRNDPGFVDSFSVVVDAQYGDNETVTMTETGFDTSVFTGSVPLDSGLKTQGDGVLQVLFGETLLAQHSNYNDPGVTTASATIVGSATWFIDEAGEVASSYMESSEAVVRVADALANADPGLVETTTVELSTELSGDSETLTLTETGPDTGVFEGTIALSLAPVAAQNGVLETTQTAGPPHEWETLYASHTDGQGATSTASATTFGSDILFLDAFGNTAATYATGSTVYVRVEDQNFNQDGVFDTVDVTVSSLTTGDSEPLTIWETSKSSGVFEGSIALEVNAASPADGLLQVQAGQEVEAAHTDFLGLTQSVARATIEAAHIELVDAAGVPSDVVVESDWARVRLVSPGDNADPFNAETVLINVTTLYYGDDETLLLTETGADTGVFAGAIRLAGPWTGTGPGFLDVANSGLPEYLPEQITATYSGFAQVSAVAHTVSSVLELVDDFGQVVSTYPEGGVVRARIFDVNRNDPGTVDSYWIVIDAQFGDNETVTVTETGFDTSVFTGSVPLDSGLTTQGDGLLQVVSGETLLAQHSNYNDPGVTTAGATIVGSATWFIDEAGEAASSYMESSQAVVRVADALANIDPGLVETTTVDLSTELSGDSETLTLTETGPDTGVFEGTIPLSLDPVTTSNGVLETTQAIGPPHEWETLYASHTDGLGQTSQASATTFGSLTLFVDAFGDTAATYATGSTVYVRVEDQNFNQAGTVDTVYVTVSSLTTGDSETLTLTETSAASGVFEGSLALEDNALAVPADALLQAQAGEELEAAHSDFLGLTQSTARATVATSQIAIVDASGVPTSEVLEADTVYVRLFSLPDNLDPGLADGVLVDLSTFYFGDDETLWLTETGVDTSVFEGSIQLSGPFAPSGPGILETANSGLPEYLPERITASHGTSTAEAIAVGSRVEFLDLTGQPATSYALGSLLSLRVEDHNWNDPGFLDTAAVVVDASATGDVETVVLTETALDSGVFEGTLPSTDAATLSQDGLLSTQAAETLTASHGNANSPLSATDQATVDGTNLVPTAADDAALTDEETAVVVAVTANDTDPELGTLSVVAVTQGAGGTVAANGDGTVTYTPGAGFTGPDSFTYVVSDPAGGQAQATVSVDVNGVPTVSVTAPADGSIFDAGSDITFTGTASDLEDGDLTASISWSSDLDGALGTGGSLTVGTLSAGLHTITALVTDSRGTTVADTIQLTVNNVPNVTISYPPDGSVYQEGETVPFMGTAVDAEDGDLSFNLTWESDLDGLLPGTGDYILISTLSAGTHVITAWVTDSQGARGEDSITLTINAPPSLTITAPADGAVFDSGDTVTFTGTASDPEDGDLSANISWTSYGAPLGTGASFSTSTLSRGVNTITASVTDSTGASAEATINVTINDPPTVLINAPLTGSTFDEGENVELIAAANDTEDGVLDAFVTWSSDLDGALGTGYVINVSTLSLGVHTITAAVTDSAGSSAEATITLTVNAVPDVAITAPLDGTTVDAGDLVTFTGTATDAEDGVVTASLSWSSDLDGPLGTGATVATSSLSAGVHTVTAQVTDAAGATGSDTVTVTVNAAPSVTITAPADGSVHTAGDNVTFTGTATDAEDGDLTTSIAWSSDVAGPLGTGASVSSSTLAAGVHTITASVTDSRGVPGSATISVTINVAPSVTITAPADGSSSTETDPVTFTGTASDSEDGVLTTSIAWSSSLDGAIGTGGSVTTSTLSVGVHTITASVTDSQGASDSATITYTVNANVAPTVTITAPSDGSVHTAGTNVTFTGTATDPEDGVLSASIAWTSSLDGALGTGASVSSSTLSAGVHTITASVTDSHGAPGSAVISVTINVAPSVSITAPANGSSSTATDPVTFTGTASDAEDGVLTAAISWTSSLDGALGLGGSVTTSTLSVGVHTITASVTDSQGAPASSAITYTVNANVAPAVTITAPANGSVHTAGTNVTFTGTATDPEDGVLSASIAWTSSLDGALGTGASVSSSTLSAGVHTITASVTDSHGAPGSAAISVTINVAPSVTITAPADGSSSTETDSVTFTGTATDAEDGVLTASISWSSSLDGALGIGGSVTTSTLSVGVHTITASVTDSQGASDSATITYTVNANVAPTVTITAPADGSVHTAGTNVTFTGTAADPEDGVLSASIAWTSSLDGALGTGASVSSSTLSAGVHTITAAVTDSHGIQGSDSISVTINAAPSVTITAPADNALLVAGQFAFFTGTASDLEDGVLTASLTWTSSLDGAIGTGGSLATTTLSAGVHTITASVTDSQGAPGTASISVTVNVQATVTITAPAHGSHFVLGSSITFTGTASDFEDGDLTPSIQWSSDLDGLFGTGASVSTSTLTRGTHVITASVTDSHGTSSEDSITVIANGAPSLTVLTPADGSTFDQGDTVTFTGTASDPEDGDLSGSIFWLSNMNGVLGTGGSVSVSTLGIGVHTITVRVSDSFAVETNDTLVVTINGPPNVNVTAPADGAVVTEGVNVTFTGTASDFEDGDLTPSISWSSSLDGALGTGGSIGTSSLSVGVHTVTASVTDSRGLPASDSLTLTINTAPVVTITAPADGTVAGTGDTVTFTGTATDAEDGNLGAALIWTSSLDGVLGAGATLATSALSAGTHTVTASVVDSHGAPGAASVAVIVKVPVQVTLTSIGTEDGWVLESSETSGVGGSIAVTGNGASGDKGIRGGDGKKDEQYKGFLSFDTSSIPDTAILRTATVRLRRATVSGTNPFATHGELRVDVQTGGFGGDTALASSDFEATATAANVAVLTEAPLDLDWSEGLLDAAGLGAVNVTGTTQLRLGFVLDDDNDRNEDYMEYLSGDDADPANRPQLVVEYLD